MKRLRSKNNLLPWFLEDHGTLPASYLKSCEKFFKSHKPQASSLTSSKLDGIQSYKLKEKEK